MKSTAGASGFLRCFVLLAALLALAAGCGGEENGSDQSAEGPSGTTAGSSSQAANDPVVTVSADKTHAVQPGDEITVTVAVENFTLDAAKMGGTNEPGVGHYRVYLDEASGDDFVAEGAAGSFKMKVPDSITDGSHPVRVELYNNDRTPVEPAAQGEVWLIVYRL